MHSYEYGVIERLTRFAVLFLELLGLSFHFVVEFFCAGDLRFADFCSGFCFSLAGFTLVFPPHGIKCRSVFFFSKLNYLFFGYCDPINIFFDNKNK